MRITVHRPALSALAPGERKFLCPPAAANLFPAPVILASLIFRCLWSELCIVFVFVNSLQLSWKKGGYHFKEMLFNFTKNWFLSKPLSQLYFYIRLKLINFCCLYEGRTPCKRLTIVPSCLASCLLADGASVSQDRPSCAVVTSSLKTPVGPKNKGFFLAHSTFLSERLATGLPHLIATRRLPRQRGKRSDKAPVTCQYFHFTSQTPQRARK